MEILAQCLVIVGIPFIRRWVCRTRKILDKPGHDVPKRPRVPTIQGLGSVFAVVLTTLLFRPELFVHQRMWGLRIGLAMLVIVNFIDELGRIVHPKYRLSPKLKFVVQAGAAMIAFLVSEVGFNADSFGPWVSRLGLGGSLILTVAWFGLCTNAINRFDGVYGLASGSSALGFLTVASLLTRVVKPLYPTMNGIELEMINATIWCARLFAGVTVIGTAMEFRPFGLMREVGTMSFGFALAYLSLLGGAKIGTMIVVLALPLFDAIRVIIDRVFRRKVSPFKGDFTHLHYRLMALGWNRNEVRVVLRSLSAFLAILMLLQGGDRRDKVIIFCLVAIIFFAINGYVFRIKKLPKAYIAGEKSDDDLEGNYLKA